MALKVFLTSLAALMTTNVAGALPVSSFTNDFIAMDTCLKVPNPSSEIEWGKQFDLVKAAGYAGITWAEGEPQQVKRAADAARKRGLRFAAIYCGATLTKTNLMINPSLRQTMEFLKGEGTLIWLYVASRDFKSSSDAGDDVAIPALRDLANLAASNGLRVAIYPHVGTWTERVQDAIRIARKVGRPNFGVTFNLCHSLHVGDEQRIPGLLTEAAPFLFMVTVNGADANVQGGWERLIQPLDRGSYDLSALLRRLRDLNYVGPVSLQGYGVKGDVNENLSHSMAGWRKYLRTLNEPSN